MTPELAPTARRYQLLEVIGRGGFGTVYKAEMRGAGGFTKSVALKILHTNNRETVARLRDEARMLGILRHRCIVQVDDLVRLNGQWAIVMEYHDGVSLDAIDRPMPLAAALDVVIEVANALDTAFTRTIADKPLALLHRDVKPSNILVEPDGSVVLLDFGVARAAFDAREAKSRAFLVGTPFYMAPERFSLRDSHAGDLFALGVTLVELVAGQLDTPTEADAVQHARRMAILLDALLDATAEEALVDIVRTTLSWSPDDRPTAAALVTSLSAIRSTLGGQNLRTWSGENILRLKAKRDPMADPLAGTLLQEELTPEAAHTLFLDQSPTEPGVPVREKPKTRSKGCGCFSFVVAAVLLLGAAAIGFVGFVVVVALLMSPPAQQLLDQQIESIFIDAGTAAESLTPEKNRVPVRNAIRRGALAAKAGDVSTWEAGHFYLRWNEVREDGGLTDNETRSIVGLIERITKG